MRSSGVPLLEPRESPPLKKKCPLSLLLCHTCFLSTPLQKRELVIEGFLHASVHCAKYKASSHHPGHSWSESSMGLQPTPSSHSHLLEQYPRLLGHDETWLPPLTLGGDDLRKDKSMLQCWEKEKCTYEPGWCGSVVRHQLVNWEVIVQLLVRSCGLHPQ